MEYVIRFEGWFPSPGQDVQAVPHMSVWRGDEKLFVAGLYLTAIKAGQLLDEIGGESEHTRPRLENAMCSLEIEHLNRRIRSGDVPETRTSVVEQIRVADAEIEELRRLLVGPKQCDYQHAEGRDLYCIASTPDDPSRIGTRRGRTVAATSHAICAACNLPDSRLLCAHLSHPAVTERSHPRGMNRRVRSAFCDKGSPHISQPFECRAGGNDCWEILVQVEDRPVAAALASPLGLVEALDFLDALWRLVFKDGALVRAGTTVNAARLALQVTTREEFESNMSALADVLKRLDIPDALLPPESQGQVDRSHTFDRLQLALAQRLPAEGAQRVDQAIRDLRRVNGVRRALEHGIGPELKTAFEALGAEWPPGNWGSAWDVVRRRTVEAITTIREELQATLP